MTIRLHLRRIRVLEVMEDLVELLVVAVSDLRTVVRCVHCGFLTAKVHDRRRIRVRDLPYGGRPTVSRILQKMGADGGMGAALSRRRWRR